jgi:DNA-binding NarL/FixJ family response regulator
MPSTSSKYTDEDIVELLERILKVVALQVGADKSLTERARLLKQAGLDNTTIAEVLNTTPGAVSVLTSNLRTRRARSSKR